ncbi:hypothetical protein [Streptomyces europaeiscabiei]|uniref:hypothetical protein n=1 Tax=Streptomyces europaeiscabiei TaxID=146819 RepID=UPI002E28200B|nr:hypothetical protein [Streptomyces europaeiscabiei]
MTRGRTQVRDVRALAPVRQPTVRTVDHHGGLSYARTAARDRESFMQLRRPYPLGSAAPAV